MSQPTQRAASAPGSPALVVTSNVQKYAIKKKKILTAEDAELFELTQAAGITVDQEVFKSVAIVMHVRLRTGGDCLLLSLVISTRIIVDLLKMNVAPQAVFQTLKAMCAGQKVAETCGTTEPSGAPQSTSITTAPTEPKAGRSKAAGGPGEKSRETSGQRVQRQPSATR
ncbi:unnamed protein product, partial [Tetraodon nigroviridis]